MNDLLLFAGCILVFIAFCGVLLYFKTGLFGLTALCVFQVAAATLSAFFFGTLLNVIPDSFTPEHETVWAYSLAGLIAMIGGIYMAWRPLRAPRPAYPRGISVTAAPSHINEQVGWLTFCVGIVAQLLLKAVWDIPTLSTAVNCLSALARIGILILLVSALATGRWRRFALAAAVYGLIAITASFDSGHSFIRIDTVVPIIVVFIASSGFAMRYIGQGIVLFVALVPLISAWMETRVLIREGSLDGLPFMERATTFFSEFVLNINFPTPYSLMDLILLRVDMTQGLASQVGFQPEMEPYAYGETVYSAFYTLIPRFMWEDKPTVAGGSEFYTRFTGEIRPSDDTTSIGIAYPFELYANGGPILVVVGLGLIGFICARLELNLLKTPKNLGSFWAIALVTAVIADGGQRTDVVLPALVAAGIAAYAMGRAIEAYFPVLGGPTKRKLRREAKATR